MIVQNHDLRRIPEKGDPPFGDGCSDGGFVAVGVKGFFQKTRQGATVIHDEKAGTDAGFFTGHEAFDQGQKGGVFGRKGEVGIGPDVDWEKVSDATRIGMVLNCRYSGDLSRRQNRQPFMPGMLMSVMMSDGGAGLPAIKARAASAPANASGRRPVPWRSPQRMSRWESSSLITTIHPFPLNHQCCRPGIHVPRFRSVRTSRYTPDRIP
jgi:hypothetical protein